MVRRREGSRRIALGYLAATVSTALFAGIYELFGHGVVSNHMVLAFLIPGIGGLAPFAVAWFLESQGRNTLLSGFRGLPLQVYSSGLATLTVGSVFVGVLEIAGTTNHLSRVYGIAGAILVAAGIVMWVLRMAGER